MSCDELVALVTAYLEGQLDHDDEQRFRAHLAGCDGCDRYLDQMRRTVRALGALPAQALPAQALPAQALPAQALPEPARDALLAAFRDWRRT